MSIFINEDSSPAPFEFNPALLMSPGDGSVWYDCGDTATMFTDLAMTVPVSASGDRVAVLLDKGPNGYHLVQGEPAYMPTFTVVGDKQFLRFNGGQFLYSGTDVELGFVAFSGFAVFNTNTNTDYMRVLSQGRAGVTGDVNGTGVFGVMTGPTSHWINLRAISGAMDTVFPGTDNTPLDVYNWTVNGASSSRMYKRDTNGIFDLTHGSPPVSKTLGRIAIGTMISNNSPTMSSMLNGDVYGIMHVGRFMAEAEIAAMKSWYIVNRLHE